MQIGTQASAVLAHPGELRRAGVVLPFILVVLATLITQLASVAYTAGQPFLQVLLPSTLALLVVTCPLAAAGLWLGRPINLGTPVLSALLAGVTGARRQLLMDARLAVPLGLCVGLLLWALRILCEPFLPPELPALGHRGVVGGMLVSISAAVGEEVWLRLGVMTTLAWLLVRLARRSELQPGIAWMANVLAAVLFGLIHLPQLAAAGAAGSAGIMATLAGNTLVGVLYGWLFWRRGLLAAITAHFAVDVALHVLPALF